MTLFNCAAARPLPLQSSSGKFTLYDAQGNVIVVGRKSPYSLYNQQLSSFEDDAGAYDQTDAAGFIKLQALR